MKYFQRIKDKMHYDEDWGPALPIHRAAWNASVLAEKIANGKGVADADDDITEEEGEQTRRRLYPFTELENMDHPEKNGVNNSNV